jgi:hypothetical protein
MRQRYAEFKSSLRSVLGLIIRSETGYRHEQCNSLVQSMESLLTCAFPASTLRRSFRVSHTERRSNASLDLFGRFNVSYSGNVPYYGGHQLPWKPSGIRIGLGWKYVKTYGILHPKLISAIVFISIGFPFLFLRTIPPPTQRRWNEAPVFILLRSTLGKAFFVVLYFAFNAYIIIVPLIGPYVTANNTPEEVKGWDYIAIVGAIVLTGIIYYYSVFGFAIDNEGEPRFPQRTILRLAGVYPMIQESDVHEPHYGWRRKVEILFPDGAVVSGECQTLIPLD